MGENYEKIKKANIKPFDITDLKPKDKPIKAEKKDKIREDSDDYFSIQITIPSGKYIILYN